MANHAHNTPCKRSPASRRSTPTAPVAPDMPPLSAEELRQEHELLASIQSATVKLRQRNLDTAVLLAQQAARYGGALVDHFAELGRRYDHLLDIPPKPALRVVKGGAA